MASKFVTLISLLLALNLLFFTTVSSTYCPPPPKPIPKCPCVPTPKVPTPAPPKVPTPAPPKVPTPAPPKVPTPAPPKATCPRDTLKLGACGDVLKSLLGIVIGTPPKTPCCSLIEGLADAEAAICLCTAIKAQVLGVQLDVPVSLSLLLNYCGKKVPSGFQCA